MRIQYLGGVILATGLLAACGADAGPAAAPASTAAASTPSQPNTGFGSGIVVKIASTSLGPALVGPDGHTLYAFTNDTNATSTCFGTCADAWPPLIIPENWQVGPGLDSGVFSSIIRTDGQRQLVAGKFPLYEYSGDAAAGDVNGEGSGDVWFAIGRDARLVKQTRAANAPMPAGTPAAAAPPAQAGQTSLGSTLVDAQGRTLYGFLKDNAGSPTCVNACANAWPPLVVSGDQLPAGLDPHVFSVVARPDGTHQLKAGKWPLYRFAGDSAAGDVNGQGSANSWFVVKPDGTLNKGTAAG